MIKSFGNQETRKFWETGRTGKVPPGNLRKASKRKLLVLDSAVTLQDLKSPPGNNLHALTGDRAGQHAIRINDQYRICFCWHEGDAYEVEIVDYH